MYDLVDRALATGLYLAPSLLVSLQSLKGNSRAKVEIVVLRSSILGPFLHSNSNLELHWAQVGGKISQSILSSKDPTFTRPPLLAGSHPVPSRRHLTEQTADLLPRPLQTVGREEEFPQPELLLPM